MAQPNEARLRRFNKHPIRNAPIEPQARRYLAGIQIIIRAHPVGYRYFGRMKITDVLRAEHAVFHNLFDHIEAAAPRLKTLAEVKALASVVDEVHQPHAKTEDDLFMEPLEHCFDQLGQNETFHAEHRKIEEMLGRAHRAKTLKEGKKLLLGAIAACRKHFDKEERIVFPLAERVLNAKTLSDLGKAWLRRREVEEK